MDIKVENEQVNLICHGCLTTDRKVRRILGEFRKMFHFLRNDDKADVQSREILLCWECFGFLKKLKMFRARIREAECILVTYLQNYYNEDGYTNHQCLTSLKYTPIDTHTYECYEEEEWLHEVANDNHELKDEEDQSEIGLTTDIKIECNDNIKEEYNYSRNNVSDYYVEEDNIVKSSRVKKEIVDKKSENKTMVAQSRNVNDSDYNDTELELENEDNVDKSSKVKKKNRSNRNKYFEKLAVVKNKKDIVRNNYSQFIKSVRLSQKETEHLLKRDNGSIINKTRYKCNKCQLFYITKLHLLRHTSFQHNEEATFPYKCAACTTMITSSEHLDEHWTASHTELLKCNLCSKLYGTRPEITYHVYKQHAKNYGCRQCGLEFGNISEFKKHYKAMHEAVICDYCKASFTRKKYLLSHLRRQHIPTYCKLCDRTYRNHTSLNHHNFFNHPELTSGQTRKELSYCVECDKQYPSVLSYKTHLIKSPQHQNKIREPCPECGKMLFKPYLEEHFRLFHLKVTKNYCKECDKYYAGSGGLKKHIRRVHKKIALPKNKYCDICERGFSTNKTLQNYRRTHTGERPFKCDFCPAAFAQKIAMKTHQKSQHKNDLPS